MGGRGAGRSFTISMFLYHLLTSPIYSRTAIMRQVYEDIRDSIYKELVDRFEEIGVAEYFRINESTMFVEKKQNSIKAKAFQKSSSNRTAKLKSLASFNIACIEEADEVGEDEFNQLDESLRTKKNKNILILSLNAPEKEHWIIKKFFDLVETEDEQYFNVKVKDKLKDLVCYINLDYTSNIENLAPETVQLYESYKTTKYDHYMRVIKGFIGSGKIGRIYSGWEQIDQEIYDNLDIPEKIGIDFGHTHPTAITGLKETEHAFYFDEIAYKSGLLAKDIYQELLDKDLTSRYIVADSEAPDKIEELSRYGLDIRGAVKGKGSVLAGIEKMKSKKVYITKRSQNIWNEYLKYCWRLDRNKESLDEPIKKDDDAMDSMRYIADDEEVSIGVGYINF